MSGAPGQQPLGPRVAASVAVSLREVLGAPQGLGTHPALGGQALADLLAYRPSGV